MLISEAFATYDEQYLSIKYRSVRLFETHRHVCKTLIEAIGDKDISNLSLKDIATWSRIISKGKSTNTIRNYLSAIKGVLKHMRRLDIYCLNPDLLPIPKREEHIMTFLTAEEVNRMIETAFSLRNKFIISLLYSSGLRVSEAISLNRGQISERTFIVKGKNNKVRTCYIDERTERLMEEYLASRSDNCSALIISNLLKERLTRGTIEIIIKNSAKRAGITKHVTPHTLRHSFASNFTKNNGGQRHLQLLLGHASLQTTQIYSHVINKEVEEQYRRFHTI